MWRSRFWMRWYVLTPAGGTLTADISALDRPARAYTSAADPTKIYLGFAVDRDAGTWSDNDSGLTGSQPTVRYRSFSVDGGLYIEYVDGSGHVVRRYSTDEGTTWGVASTIFSTDAPYTNPTSCVADGTGIEFHFARNASGNIARLAKDPSAVTYLAESTVVTGSVSDSPMAAYARRGGAEVYLLYRNTSGAIVQVKSTDGGKTFS
jgi:hypothetical protein